MFLLILMIYKLDHSYLGPQNKIDMYRLLFGTMFPTLRQLADERGVILSAYTFSFCDFPQNSNDAIDIYEYFDEMFLYPTI